MYSAFRHLVFFRRRLLRRDAATCANAACRVGGRETRCWRRIPVVMSAVRPVAVAAARRQRYTDGWPLSRCDVTVSLMLSDAARCANNAAIAESELCGLWADCGRTMGGLWADSGRLVALRHYLSTFLPCFVCLSTSLQLRVRRFVRLTLMLSNSRYYALYVTFAPIIPPRVSSPPSLITTANKHFFPFSIRIPRP
jgi:hypothetical protein